MTRRRFGLDVSQRRGTTPLLYLIDSGGPKTQRFFSVAKQRMDQRYLSRGSCTTGRCTDQPTELRAPNGLRPRLPPCAPTGPDRHRDTCGAEGKGALASDGSPAAPTAPSILPEGHAPADRQRWQSRRHRRRGDTADSAETLLTARRHRRHRRRRRQHRDSANCVETPSTAPTAPTWRRPHRDSADTAECADSADSAETPPGAAKSRAAWLAAVRTEQLHEMGPHA